MNYYDARQTKNKSGWHYTCMNDGAIWPVGYCAEHEPHATEREARECFGQYLLDGEREETYGDWTGCAVCDKPTKRGMTTRPPLGHGYPLCDEHFDGGRLKKLSAPLAVGKITASF
jgi:hypothetical protein